MKYCYCCVVLIMAMGIFAGCEDEKITLNILARHPEPIKLPEPEKKPTKIDYQPLQMVLNRAVNASGYIMAYHYPFIEKNLVRQLQILSAVGPTTAPDQFKTKKAKLAYWYNARAAWTIKLAMLNHKKLFTGKTDYSETIRLMKITKCPIDGTLMSRFELDDKIRELGGFMAEVAAPGVTLDRAPMPQAPFYDKDFPGCIEAQFNSFVNSTSRFVCNYDKRTWYIPRIVWQYKEKLTDIYLSNYPTPQVSFASVLSAWASGSAKYRLQNNVGYHCVKNPHKTKLAIIKE